MTFPLEILISIAALLVISVVVFKVWRSSANKVHEINRLSNVIRNLETESKCINGIPIPPTAEYCVHNWQVISDKVLEVRGRKTHILSVGCPNCGIKDINRTEIEEITPVSECRHSWKTLVQKDVPSAYEQMNETLLKLTNGYVNSKTVRDAIEDITTTITSKVKDKDNDSSLFNKEFIKVVQCSDCGKIHEIKASNYDSDAG